MSYKRKIDEEKLQTVRKALRFGKEFKKKRMEHVYDTDTNDEYEHAWVVKAKFDP